MVNDNFAGFLDSHPDIRHYRLGLAAYIRQDYGKAMSHFRRAAYFADKPSQAMSAEMHWNGKGMQADRASAYAWMDLAAEREYPELTALRERFWGAMTSVERERALQAGKALYKRYGDEVAQRRIEVVLRRTRKAVTGSRTGFTGNARIYALPPGTDDPCRGASNCESPVVAIDAGKFFASNYWEPKYYFKWREDSWREEVRTGKVKLGDVEPLPQEAQIGTSKQ